jgi:hypothetical protein
MPSGLEVEINTLLREDRGTSKKAAAELLRRWRSEQLDPEQQLDCAQFLVAGGFFKDLFQQVQNLVQQGLPVPWAQFAEAVGRAGIKPEEHEISAILEGARSEGAAHELVRSSQLDLYSREFGNLRLELREEAKKKTADLKQTLKEKLLFMRNNRLFDQEKAVLEEILAIFPVDEEFADARQSYDLRWAREIVSHSHSLSEAASNSRGLNAGLRSALQWKTEQISSEQSTVRDLIVEHAKELSRNDPRLAYDLAISLHLMDFNREALGVLELAQVSPAADWLRLELMIRARKFVDALEETKRLESLYVGQSDTMFAVIYSRARALHGLGQAAMAIELLRSLVRVRPGYKNVQSLLLDWGGGDS